MASRRPNRTAIPPPPPSIAAPTPVGVASAAASFMQFTASPASVAHTPEILMLSATTPSLSESLLCSKL